MTGGIIRDEPLSWRGWLQSRKALPEFVGRFIRRVADARGLVESIVAKGSAPTESTPASADSLMSSWNQRNCAICRATSS